MNEIFWWLTRGTGVTAFVALTGSLALGIAARSGRDLAGLGRFGVSEVHRTLSACASALVVAHVVTLLLDTVSGVSLLSAVVPFTSSYEPVGVGLGVLATDLLVVVVVVSLLRHRVGPRVFRVVHRLTYALWPLAAFHFLLSGTDSGTWWARAVLVTCGVAVATAVGWRFSGGFSARSRPARAPAGTLTRSAPERTSR